MNKYEDYDYYEAVYDDIRKFIRRELSLTDYETLDELKEDIANMYDEDTLTGWFHGSYTDDPETAALYLSHNFDLLADALADLGGLGYLGDGAQACDVACRVYVFDDALNRVIWDIEEEFNAAHEAGEEREM